MFEPDLADDAWTAPWDTPEERAKAAEESRRDKVKAELIATIAVWARDMGYTTWGHRHIIQRQFPKVPPVFILRAIGEIGREDQNAFLDELASTIEGEIIRRAIGGGTD